MHCGKFGEQPVVRRGAVDALARQDSPMVQIALIDFLVDMREKESVDTLRQLAKTKRSIPRSANARKTA